jgi:hypothetical protein
LPKGLTSLRYSVSAEVIYIEDTRVVISDKKDFRPGTPKISNYTRTDKPRINFNPDEFKLNPQKPVIPPKYENLTDFAGVKVAGSFKVDNYTNKDVVQREKVIDLKVYFAEISKYSISNFFYYSLYY